MGIIYHKLHRLRTRQSWIEIAEAVSCMGGSQDGKSVSRVTLHELASKPHKRAKPKLQAAIDKFHEQIFGSPFPTGANRLLALYRSLIKNGRPQEVEDLTAFVTDHLDHHIQCDLFRARLLWLMGNIKEDLLRQARDKGTGEERHLRNQAVQYYRQAALIVEGHELHHEAFKLKQNIFACYANAVQPGHRNHHAEVRKCIQETGIIDTALRVLDVEPFQWLTARVALMCVAIRQGPQDLALGRDLFERLVQANEHFLDPGYQPDYFLALAEDEDTRWICEQVLNDAVLKRVAQLSKR